MEAHATDVEQQEDDTREIAIEAWNIIFGRALFTYIRIPASWVTGFQLNEPLVANRFLYKNLVWVGTGEIECLISRERPKHERPNLDFRLKVATDLMKKGPVAPTPNDLVRRYEEKGYRIEDCGELHAGDHQGSYVLWTAYRRRFRIAGKPRLVARLEGYIPCDETKRLLTLTWTSPSPNLILEHSSELIRSLNSVLCHGHEVQPDEKIL